MLPPFIIEQIRRLEEEERRRNERPQPRLELPVDDHRPLPPKREPDEDADRGVIILDIA